MFLISLTAQAFHLFVVRALYAVGNTRIPFYVTLFSSALGLCAAFYLFMVFVSGSQLSEFLRTALRLEGVSGIEVLALPMGYSIALIVHSTVLLLAARKLIFVSIKALFISFMQALISALLGGYVAYAALNWFATYWTTDTLATIFFQGFFAVLFGACVYVLIQYLFRNTELREISATLHRKFGRGTVVPPQDEDTLAI